MVSAPTNNGISSRVVKISKNGKVVGKLKISNPSADDNNSGSIISGSRGGGVASFGTGARSSSGSVAKKKVSVKLPCRGGFYHTDAISERTTQSCQLTSEIESVNLTHKKSLRRAANVVSCDIYSSNSQARYMEKDSAAASDEASIEKKSTCPRIAVAAPAAVTPTAPTTAGAGGEAVKTRRHPPSDYNEQRRNETSDPNNAFKIKCPPDDVPINCDEDQAEPIREENTEETFPVDTTRCVLNSRSNIFKTSLKNCRNPVQPGFRGDRIVPSSLGMAGSVVSVTKGGQFI